MQLMERRQLDHPPTNQPFSKKKHLKACNGSGPYRTFKDLVASLWRWVGACVHTWAATGLNVLLVQKIGLFLHLPIFYGKSNLSTKAFFSPAGLWVANASGRGQVVSVNVRTFPACPPPQPPQPGPVPSGGVTGVLVPPPMVRACARSISFCGQMVKMP